MFEPWCMRRSMAKRRMPALTALEFGKVLEQNPTKAKEYVLRLMRMSGYSYAGAARRIRVNVGILRSWIKTLGCESELTKVAHDAGYVLGRKRLRPAETPVWIYFVQAGPGGPIKVGWTLDIEQRLGSLRVDNPEELTLLATAHGGLDVEQRLHQIFESTRIRGEWFRPSPKLMELIDRLSDGYDIHQFLEAHDE
jgi:hypothetical protein